MNAVHRYVAEEEGIKIETEDPTGGLVEPIDPVTKRKMPARVLMPDPGWDHNPAKTAWKPDLSKYPKALKDKFKKDRRAK